MSARPKKAVMGRPKTIVGKLVTCPFVLTHKQSQWVTRRAKACKVSRSEIMRALVQVGIVAETANIDAVTSSDVHGATARDIAQRPWVLLTAAEVGQQPQHAVPADSYPIIARDGDEVGVHKDNDKIK